MLSNPFRTDAPTAHADERPSRIQRVRHELHRREVTVARIETIGRHFLRITFTGESLATFTSLGFDDHVKFMFTDAQGEVVRRDYTPRHIDLARREVNIEFALHGDGPADAWARQAQVGMAAVIGGPKGSMILPTDVDWHVLIGDDSALPAIHRRLEELPASARVQVIVEVKDADDRRDFSPCAAHIDVQWVNSPRALLEAVTRLELPPGEGFVWAAGEAATMARTRELLVEQHRLPRDAMRVSAYWKRGATDFHENL